MLDLRDLAYAQQLLILWIKRYQQGCSSFQNEGTKAQHVQVFKANEWL